MNALTLVGYLFLNSYAAFRWHGKGAGEFARAGECAHCIFVCIHEEYIEFPSRPETWEERRMYSCLARRLASRDEDVISHRTVGLVLFTHWTLGFKLQVFLHNVKWLKWGSNQSRCYLMIFTDGSCSRQQYEVTQVPPVCSLASVSMAANSHVGHL